MAKMLVEEVAVKSVKNEGEGTLETIEPRPKKPGVPYFRCIFWMVNRDPYNLFGGFNPSEKH